MKYSKEVVEARKVYDSLVIEQREAKKELEQSRPRSGQSWTVSLRRTSLRI